MHPRQASLLNYSATLLSKMAAKSPAKQSGTNLWKYTCPESGQDFYLPSKKTTVRSPYTGKSFTAKPEKDTLTEVGKELKEDAKAQKAAPKSKKATLLDLLNGQSDESEVL